MHHRTPESAPRRRAALRRHPVAAACALLGAAMGGLALPAVAQTTGATAETQTVTVTGLRRSIENSVATKRNSDAIVEAVSAEDLGKLPDVSIAESLARLPGLTGQRGPDGRVNVISIRGLSPGFAGALLNGREVVSSNDSRAVEYDQFPAELIGSAVVYKTGDAGLMGQGLSGTVDLRPVRPLDSVGRQLVVNLRGEQNSNGNLVPGVASPTGKRFSISYVDQFANNTVGVALGFARLDVSTQLKLTELVTYGDFTPYGLPISGNAPAKFGPDGAFFGVGQSMLPMFWTATSSTKRNTRDGLMAVVEYKPNKDLRSQLDLYYSKFDTEEVGGKFLMSMFGNWGNVSPTLTNVQTTQVGRNTYTTSATADQLAVTTGNFSTKRKDEIAALGWNTSLKLSDRWTAESDLSWSRDTRQENYSEVYAAPFNNATQQWLYGAFKWNVPVDGGAQTFSPLVSNYLGTASVVKLGDQPAFNFVGDQEAYAGAIRTPKIKDEIKSLRLNFKRSMDGIFGQFTGGFNVTQRTKDVSKNESRLLMPTNTAGQFVRDIPASAVRSPFDMSWAGIPSLIHVDVPALVSSGALSQQVLFSQKVDNDSNVSERVSTAFAKLDIDHTVMGVPVRGNIGAQFVHTTQDSKGWEYRGNNANPDINLLFRRTGGTSYDDVLPSLNLVAEFKGNLIARFGLAKTMVRPNIVDMRAGTSTPSVVATRENPTDPTSPVRGAWTTAYAGNPELQPWRAAGIDLSVEKYFGKRSYISAAAFRKNLLNYIYNQTVARDNSSFPVILPTGVTADKVDKLGPVVQPVNGQGGKIEGIELAASLEGGLLHPALDGFGVVVSGSKLSSSILEKDNGNVPLNGLSGRSNSLTFYYEKHGIQARVSQRYRSPFTATTRDIFLNSTTRQQAADKVVDLQLGYAFEQGPYKGLSLLMQVYNLTNTTSTNLVSAGENAPDKSQLLPNYTYQFGRVVVLGANYRF